MDSAEEQGQSKARPWYRKKRYVLPIAAFVALAALGSFVEEPDEPEEVAADAEDESDQAAERDEPAQAPDPEPASQGPPGVPDEVIQLTYDHFEEETLIRDVHIDVNPGEAEISIAMQVNAATNEETAQGFLDDAARFLASQTAVRDDSLDGPGHEHYGDLWDHYTGHLGAGPGSEPSIARGVLLDGSHRVSW